MPPENRRCSPVSRRFRASVRLSTLAGVMAGTADCTVVLEPQRFSHSRWHGTLTNLQPALARGGRYVLRFPNGRAAEIEVSDAGFGGCVFEGIGPSPIG